MKPREALEEPGEVGIVLAVEDDESRVDGNRGAIFRDLDRMAVAARPVFCLEDRDLVFVVQEVGADETGDTRTHDGDSHGDSLSGHPSKRWLRAHRRTGSPLP